MFRLDQSVNLRSVLNTVRITNEFAVSERNVLKSKLEASWLPEVHLLILPDDCYWLAFDPTLRHH